MRSWKARCQNRARQRALDNQYSFKRHLSKASHALEAHSVGFYDLHSSQLVVDDDDGGDERSVDGGISIGRSRGPAISQAATNHFERICCFTSNANDLVLTVQFTFSHFTMVQGKTKGLSMKGPNVRAAKKAAANPKKGLRAIAPKKAPLVKQAKMHQVRMQCR